MEEIEKRQQDMQEKVFQGTKMVKSLTKRKGIIEDLDSQDRHVSWKNNDGQFAVLNPNNPCEQEKLKKYPSGQSEHINVQQRCNFLDKKLKEIEDVNDLGSVDPKDLCLVPDLVMPPKFKMPTFEKYDGTKCFENHLATYCHKMAGHVHNEDLLIHVLYNSLIGAAAQWYMKMKKEQIRT